MRKGTAFRYCLLTLFVALVSTAGGCSDDDDDPVGPGNPTGSLTFNFDHNVDGAAISLALFNYTTAAGNSYSITRLDYYVSNFKVHRVDGTNFGVGAVHYRSATDLTTRSYTMGGIPNGDYNAISFTFGLDVGTNITDGLPPTHENLNMIWPPTWGGGYHYMILEGNYLDGGGNSRGYKTHTGRRFIEGDMDASGQGPDSVSYHHFFEVKIPVGKWSVAGDGWEVDVSMNINKWYDDPLFDLETFFPQGSPGIMVNLLAQALLLENGPSCFSAVDPKKP